MRIGNIVDLSRRVDDGTQVYPGDPHPHLEPATTLEVEGVNVLSVHLGSHSGTHVDAPYHFIEGGERIDTMDVRLFVGPAAILDVRGKGPRERIRGRGPASLRGAALGGRHSGPPDRLGGALRDAPLLRPPVPR